MKATDVTPSMIGKQVRVEAPDVTIAGQLQDLAVITETVSDGNMINPDHTEEYLAGVLLNVSGHELRLRGNETVTIIESLLK